MADMTQSAPITARAPDHGAATVHRRQLAASRLEVHVR